MLTKRAAEPEAKYTASIGVFAGACNGVGDRYTEIAGALGATIAQRGLRIVYGGAAIGLMGAVARGARAAGGEVVGVIPQCLAHEEIMYREATSLHVVASMQDRKLLMGEMSDGFVVLPGGTGTLDEFFEMATGRLLGLHQKPIAILDPFGFFDHLVRFVDHAIDQGFVLSSRAQWLIYETDIGRLMERTIEALPERGGAPVIELPVPAG